MTVIYMLVAEMIRNYSIHGGAYVNKGAQILSENEAVWSVVFSTKVGLRCQLKQPNLSGVLPDSKTFQILGSFLEATEFECTASLSYSEDDDKKWIFWDVSLPPEFFERNDDYEDTQ